MGGEPGTGKQTESQGRTWGKGGHTISGSAPHPGQDGTHDTGSEVNIYGVCCRPQSVTTHEGNGSSSDGNKYKRETKPQISEDREKKRLVVQVCKLRINTDTDTDNGT